MIPKNYDNMSLNTKYQWMIIKAILVWAGIWIGIITVENVMQTIYPETSLMPYPESALLSGVITFLYYILRSTSRSRKTNSPKEEFSKYSVFKKIKEIKVSLEIAIPGKKGTIESYVTIPYSYKSKRRPIEALEVDVPFLLQDLVIDTIQESTQMRVRTPADRISYLEEALKGNMLTKDNTRIYIVEVNLKSYTRYGTSTLTKLSILYTGKIGTIPEYVIQGLEKGIVESGFDMYNIKFNTCDELGDETLTLLDG